MDADTALPLFDSLPTPRWLPGETVYSLAARYHRLAGLTRAATTSRILFGRPRGGFPHALPSGIDHFAAAFDGVLGTPREILLQHTIAPQLLVARAKALREWVCQTLAQGPAGVVKAKLGLLASGFGGALPLKACAVCVEEDENDLGLSYWRLDQQLAGVWVCTDHGALLACSTVMASGQARYNWVLPKCDDLATSLEPGRELDPSSQRALTPLTEISKWLLTIGQRGGLDGTRTIELLWQRLAETGLATGHRRLRQGQSAEQFCRHYEPVRFLSELANVAATPSIAYSQLRTVLDWQGVGLHPLRLATVIAWLFPESSEFMDRYSEPAASDASPDPVVPHLPNTTTDGRRQLFLQHLEGGASITAAANRVGVYVVTGQAWAAADGRTVPTRPSRICGDLHDRLVEQLRAGADRALVARELDLSVASVTRVLRTEIGLQDAWLAARAAATRATARSAWTNALEAAGGSPKLAREMAPAAYAHLYRSDRPWLKQQNHRCERPRSNNSAVDWRARDEALSIAVRNAAEALTQSSSQRIRLLDLLTELPALRQRRSNLDQLPLTRRAIEAVLGRRW